MYNYAEHTKGMPGLAVGMPDQRKPQYPGYHVASHPDVLPLSRSQLVPGTGQPKAALSSMGYPTTHGHGQSQTSPTASGMYYYGANSTEASARYQRSHANSSGPVPSQTLPGSGISSESHKHSSPYQGSLQNGMPVRSDRSRLASVGYPRPSESSMGQLSAQSSHAGSVNAGLIVSYPNSVQTGISQSVSQNRAGLTGVFKINNQNAEYRQQGSDAKGPVTMDKHSPAGTIPGMYQGPMSAGYQQTSVPQSPKQSAYSHSGVTPTSQTMKMTLPGQTNPIAGGMHSVNRNSPIRQGYQYNSNQYGSLHSPTATQQRPVVNEGAYGPQRSVPVSYHPSSSTSSDPLRRSSQSSSVVHNQHNSYDQSQRSVMPSAGVHMDKRPSGYHVPMSSSSSSSSRPQGVPQGVAVRGMEYPVRRVDTKEQVKPNIKPTVMQPGMPLDLTSVDNRTAESPLDLSVKTRKRCADTTIDQGMSDSDPRCVPPVKKPCIKADSPVDLRSAKEHSKVMTATVPQPQKYTYDTEGAPRYDIKIQHNIYQNNAYMKNKYDTSPTQRMMSQKQDSNQNKSETVMNRYYSAHEANIAHMQNYQTQASIKSPVMIQSKFDDQKQCYPSPPEVTAYPSEVSQKTSTQQLHVSSQSSLYSKPSYTESSDYRRSMAYSQPSSVTFRSKSDIQTTNAYHTPVTSYMPSQSSQPRVLETSQTIGSGNGSSSSSFKQQQQQTSQHHMYSRMQMLHQRQQVLQHQQQQQHLQQHQRPHPNQYYSQGVSKPAAKSQKTLPSQQYTQNSKSAYPVPRRDVPTHTYDSANHETIRSQAVQRGNQAVPSIEMKLPCSSGYMVATPDRKSVQKPPQSIDNRQPKPVSEQQDIQNIPRPRSSNSTPEIQITAVTAPPGVKTPIQTSQPPSQPTPPSQPLQSTQPTQPTQQARPNQTTQQTQPTNNDTQTSKEVNIAKYAEPLTINIPTTTSNSEQQKTTTSTTTTTTVTTTVQSVMPHKILSKKHRILNALEADQKRSTTHISAPMSQHLQQKVDGTFKVPTVCPSSPASPKMPILSPHDKIPPPEDTSVHNEPPQLDPPATPVKNRLAAGVGRGEAAQRAQQGDKGKEKDVTKSVIKAQTAEAPERTGEKFVRQEVMRRNSLPERPSMYQKNIPVANVAPFVHSNQDQIGPNSDGSQLVSEDMFSAESSSSPEEQTNKTQNNPRTESKQRKSATTKKQKKEPTKNTKKSSHILAAPLKHKLLKFHEMEQASIARSFRKQGLRPRQKQVSVKKAPKPRRKTIRVAKKQKQEKAEDSEGFEVSKSPKEEEIDASKIEPDPAVKPDRNLRRAIIKIDRIEDSAERRLKVEQPASPTRRTVSILSKRAQELKRKAIDGPRRRGKGRRLLRSSKEHGGFSDFKPQVLQTRTRHKCSGRRRGAQYNRNAAYEKELRKDESRRALNRAKRRARMRRVTRQDASYPEEDEYDDDEEDDIDGCWEISRTSQRQASGSGRGRGGLMLKLFYRSGQETAPSRGRRTRHIRDGGAGARILGLARKAARGKARTRGKMRARGKFQTQFEQFVRQDLDTESEVLEDGFGNFYVDENATTYQVRNADGGGFTSYPIPPEMKKLNINKNSGETLLHRAARLGIADVALYCLRTRTVAVNARDNAGYTALHESCVKGNLNVARVLLEHGADVNCCSQDGIRPVHDAVENDHPEIVRLLLSYGADPTIATYSGKTPIKISHSLNMTTLLKGYLGDINGFDSENEETPWEFAGSSAVTDTFEETGFDIFADLPSDPEDESEALFDVQMTSAIRTYDLHLDSADRLDRYVYVPDIMADFRLAREDLKKICANKIQLRKISAKELCKSTQKNALTFCQQTHSPVELMGFEDYKTIETKLLEHLNKTEEASKKKPKLRKRPSTPSKKTRKQHQKQQESSDNESDATIEFGSQFNSDEESIDFEEAVCPFEESFEPQELESRRKVRSKQEHPFQGRKETIKQEVKNEPKLRRRSNDGQKCDLSGPGKSELRHTKSNSSHFSKSETNSVFKSKLHVSKTKSDTSISKMKGSHSSMGKFREHSSFDAALASKKAQSDIIYSFDEHDLGTTDDDPEITFPRVDRLFTERSEKHSLRKDRSVDCKRGLEKSFRTIMSNSKDDHFRLKIGTVSHDSHTGSENNETGAQNHVIS